MKIHEVYSDGGYSPIWERDDRVKLIRDYDSWHKKEDKYWVCRHTHEYHITTDRVVLQSDQQKRNKGGCVHIPVWFFGPTELTLKQVPTLITNWKEDQLREILLKGVNQ